MSREELFELFAQTDTDGFPGVGNRGTPDSPVPIRRGGRCFVSLSIEGFLVVVAAGDELDREECFCEGPLAVIVGSLDDMLRRRGEYLGWTRWVRPSSRMLNQSPHTWLVSSTNGERSRRMEECWRDGRCLVAVDKLATWSVKCDK